MKKLRNVYVLSAIIAILLNACKKDDSNTCNPIYNTSKTYGIMTDQDGNVYKTITIGTQTWMAENLRTTKYRDGSIIPNVTIDTDWTALSTGAFCNYDNTKDNNIISTYGRLYNWFAATDKRNIAPIGWHIPNKTEWLILINSIDGGSGAGGSMKEIGEGHWASPNTGATNESGFTSLPSGARSYSRGTFGGLGKEVFYWSCSEYDTSYAWGRSIDYNETDCYLSRNYKQTGYSVRLVKD